MNNVTTETSLLNNTNITCLTPLLWTQDVVDSRKSQLYVCIIASIIHVVFWLQLVFHSSVRKTAMQWIYAYLITDILLLFRFFFLYIVHTKSTECEPNSSWILFICYFEATVDNYLNILEVYILLALNICRYVQIASNQNVYQVYKNILIFTHLGIYFISLLYLFVQFLFGWTQVVSSIRDSCGVSYTNVYIQVFNMIIGFALPISLNILVIYVSVRYVRLTSTLRQGRHHVSAREKYHRSLVIQFLIFYTIWLALWSPNIIVFQVSISSDNLTTFVRLLNFIEIALDPIIIAALDVRFWQAWRKTWISVRNILLANRPHQGRIHPSRINVDALAVKTRLQRTGF